MMLRVPDTLTIDCAEKYVVSIRLWPGGLSFAGHIPSEKGSFFYTETAFDPVTPYPQALKDAFFEHVFLSYPYKHVYIICVNRLYTLAPKPVFTEEAEETLMSFVFSAPGPGYKILHESLPALEAEMVYGLPEEVYSFCCRSLIRPQFTHAVTPALLCWRERNLPCFRKQLYVSVHENIMDAACYDRGALTFLNSFDSGNAADLLYYLLYIWKQTGMNQAEDELLLFAPASLYQELKVTLRKYVNHVVPVESPRTTAETDTAHIPLDIISLFGCES
ncbi:MAG: DUF3822 family protein [Tannerella sp.]|jgi:hypothetical protein|nr:DUF3822 family protein [Tannerella sp.]